MKYYIECYNKQKAANERLQARIEVLEGALRSIRAGALYEGWIEEIARETLEQQEQDGE